MSSVAVTDKRGGVFEVKVSFTYGECDRLPFNALRKVGARIEQVPNGGIDATAEFNVRNRKEADHFVEVLDLFGVDGSFVHGSPADPETLEKAEPEDDDESGKPVAVTGSAQRGAGGAAAAGSSSDATPTPPAGDTAAEADDAPAQAEYLVETDTETFVEDEPEPEMEVEEEDAEPEMEVEADAEAEPEPGQDAPADADWRAAGDAAVSESLAANENRAEMLKRVGAVAGEAYTVAMVRTQLIKLLQNKFKDATFVATTMKRRGWKDVSAREVKKVVRQS